jgi:CheY-like chemotaxis protein
MTVLMVEDEDVFSKIAVQILHNAGIEAVMVKSGKEALEMLEKVQVDGIILDLMLPEMNGVEFLMEKEKIIALKQIPVIVCSGYVVDHMALKDHAILEKPVKMEKLIAMIHKVFGKEAAC